MKSDGSATHPGWVRLSYCFSETELAAFARHNPFIGRGRRLDNQTALTSDLPSGFKANLEDQGYDPTILRAIGFNKSLDANWSLPWHQDRVIAMPEHIQSKDYTNWTRKDGVLHCEPPQHVLRTMAFAYIAFDVVSENEGGIELAEGSQLYGKIEAPDIPTIIGKSYTVAPKLQIGECLLIDALTLHRSGPNHSLKPRKAMRLDFRKHIQDA